MKIILASDHAGESIKNTFKSCLEELKIEYEDLSPHNDSDDDYPDFAKKVSEKVLKENQFGFLSCGTGIGISIAANRFKGIRAALCSNEQETKLARSHNDANILVLNGNKFFSKKEIKDIIKTFIQTKFEGGRHERRVKKLDK